jgi:hypothetical protein
MQRTEDSGALWYSTDQRLRFPPDVGLDLNDSNSKRPNP